MGKLIDNQLSATEAEKSNRVKQILSSIKSSPKKVTVGLATLTAIATLGYGGVQYLVRKKLPPLIETQISNLIDRPLDLGEVRSFSLGGIEFSQTVIPATENDPDRISVEGLKIDFNIFPLILRRTLPLDITLIQPDVYLEQKQNGEWINLDFLPTDSEQKSPIDFDLGVDVEEGNITAIPYGKSAITVKITGSGQYQQQEPLIAYDLDATINRANATIQGETNLTTGQTDTKLLVKDLALADLTTLLPNFPVTLSSGVFNADLDVNLPSLAEISTADIKGIVSINNVAGKVTDLSAPIKAGSELDFNGQNAKVKQTQASLGDIIARIDGSVHLDKGYELDVNVLPFQLSSLPPEIIKQIPVEIGGELEAALQLQGAITEPLLTGSINNIQTISIDRTQFKEIKANFRADLDRVVLETLEIIPVAGGVITADGVVETRIGETLADQQESNFTKMPLALNWQGELPTSGLINPYYQLPQQLTVGRLKATGEVGGTINNPQALINWQIPEANSTAIKEDISGQGELLLTNNNLRLQNTRVRVGDGVVDLKAEANLTNQNWQADIQASGVALNPFLTQLDIPNLNLERAIALQAAKIRLNGKLENLNPNQVTGIADLNLDIDGSKFVVNSKLNAGIIQGNINTNEINLNRILATLPLPTTVRSSQTNFSGELQQLLNFSANTNLNSFQADITADLNVAKGTVKAIARMDNNQWQAEVNANDLSSQVLLNTFAPSNLGAVDLDDIDVQIDVSGDINYLISNQVNLPISIDRVAVQSGEQYLNAKGNLILSDVTNNLDITNTQLDINANLDLNRLPVKQILAATSENNQFADSIEVQGKAQFKGQFSGQKLMSTPTQMDNLALTGDLRLLDFALNNVDFDSVMAGKVNINPASGIDLNLQGQQDSIAAALVPCKDRGCSLPYLPTNLELRQGQNTPEPVILTGKRDRDLFSLELHHFPLALLNLAPGKNAGIEGALAGKTTGNVDVNLFTLATKGKISIENPGVGYIKADKLAADFNYDPNHNVAQVTTASLHLGNSKYNLNAALDLQTGAIDGQLEIPEAYMQDVIQTLRWFTLEDAIALFTTTHASAVAVETNASIDTFNHSITQKLAQLGQIEKRIQQTATAKNSGTMPTALDIQGKYTGSITLGGTLAQPEADFEIAGNNWLWEPQVPFVDIVHPVGMFKEESEFTSIERILTKGKLVGNVVSFEEAKLQMEGALFSLTGEFSPQQQDAQLKVENLSLDTIDQFANFPVDVAGAIALESRLTGTFAQPEVTGNITLADAAYNGNLLPAVIAGNFTYKKKELKFTTTEPSSIQIAATVPYPPQETQTGDRLTLNAQLDTEALALLGIFTQESLTWIDGQGTANIQATANLNLNRKIPLENLNVRGAIALNEAQLVLTNPFFTVPIIATGKINLKNQFIDVETLQASVAGKDLEVKGRLPLLHPVANLNNPLQVTIPKGKIDIERLYRGNVSGKIIVTSAAVTPTISGAVDLTDGKVFFWQQEQNAVYTFDGNSSLQPENSPIVAKLNDFWLRLDRLKIQQSPLYEFALKGELLLNGTADSPQNIQPEGALYLTQGNVNWLGGDFSLIRSRQNSIVFSPEAGMLNPKLNIQLKTEVQDFSKSQTRVAESQQNEISDSLTRTHESDSVKVNLMIEGEADKLLSTIDKNNDYCRIRPNNASLVEVKPYYSTEELNLHTKCFNAGVLAATQETSLSLINSPAVELTSSPSRSEGEIISLLQGELFDLVDTLSKDSQSVIWDVGVNTFIIDPLVRGVFSQVEDGVIRAGKSMGLDYLGLYPRLEGVYEIQQNSSVRFTYNHGYLKKDDDEVHLEYRFNF